MDRRLRAKKVVKAFLALLRSRGKSRGVNERGDVNAVKSRLDTDIDADDDEPDSERPLMQVWCADKFKVRNALYKRQPKKAIR